MTEIKVLYLSEKDVKSTGVTIKDCIEIIEEVLKAHADGKVIVPPKLFLDMRDFGFPSDGDVMPAYVLSGNICGVKWIGGSPENHKLGLPYLFSVLILNEPRTFRPLAIMSANLLTAMRTGAATAVAAKYLAPDHAENVCIIGAGLQGRYQLLALNEVLKIKKVKVFDIEEKVRENYIKEMSEKICAKIEEAKSIKDAADEADVIITATTANEDLIKENWINKPCFVCSIGTFRELGIEFIRSMDKIIVDHLEQAKRTGTLMYWFSKGMLSEGDIYAELSHVVECKAERESQDERILAVLTGMGSQDVSLARYIYGIAKKKKIGQLLKWPL
ncbi:MAG: ornithine cyclodeaminase family protein [Candidatus Bathyarchaeia archaeon]